MKYGRTWGHNVYNEESSHCANKCNYLLGYLFTNKKQKYLLSMHIFRRVSLLQKKTNKQTQETFVIEIGMLT
jgi:hypothetical protein